MRSRQWQDAVVDLQIHDVSEPTRRTLSAEARARGESLQEYLLDLLDREAADIANRGLVAEWAAGSMENESRPVDFVTLVRSERESRETQPAHG
jgi:antitoxin FitA